MVRKTGERTTGDKRASDASRWILTTNIFLNLLPRFFYCCAEFFLFSTLVVDKKTLMKTNDSCALRRNVSLVVSNIFLA